MSKLGPLMIRIRKATRNDAQVTWDIRKYAVLAQCSQVYQAEQIETWTSGQASAKWADIMEGCFYVAVDGHTVVATGMLTIETGSVDAIFVLPSYMGQGIGAQMMQFIERLALESGVRLLTLDATLNAAAFYRRCGWSGDVVSTYHSPRGISMACIPMTKHLVSELSPDGVI